MKIPLRPPNLYKKLTLKGPEFAFKLSALLDHIGPTTNKDEYIHWDKLRHLQLPEGVNSSELWWFAIKYARKMLYKTLPFKDKEGNNFVIATPDILLKKLNSINRTMVNFFPPAESFNTQIRDNYLMQSLIEEAITSSQLEGASTTRDVAKEMLRTNRKPKTISEKMIFNNFKAMQFIREIKDESLTIEIIKELQRILTEGTLPEQDVGRCRTGEDNILIYDPNDGELLHTPPPAKELNKRLQTLCDFANKPIEEEKIFLDPIIKAILLHFMLAYDHPFVDGNGRTARALFYWYMANQKYSLIEHISISSILKQSPIPYARAFLHTETDENDTTYFIIHQLDVILKAFRSLHEYLEKKAAEIKETEELLFANLSLQAILNYRQVMLLKHALKHPNMHYKIASHRQSHNVTYDTARNDLLELAKLGLLIKQKIGKAFIFTSPPDLKKRVKKT